MKHFWTYAGESGTTLNNYFGKKTALFAMKIWILLDFQNLQEIY